MDRYKVKVRYTFNVDYTFVGPKSLDEAKEWAGKSAVGKTSDGVTRARVFQVEPVGEAMQDPRHLEGIRAKRLRVIRRVLPDE
jgi:hypothetical protein